MDFIYIILYDTVIKIGSTRYPINRLVTYKTSYYSKSNTPLKYERLYKINKNCYEIDEKLKYDVDRGFKRSVEIGLSNVGTEFYETVNFDLIEKWFDKNKIGYEVFNIKNCTRENYEDYSKEIVRKNKNIISDTNKIILRGYQNEIYKRLTKYLNTNQRCTLNIFCGGGKTVIYQKYMQDYLDKYSFIVLVVPTLNLLSDMRDRWLYITKNTNKLEISSDLGTTIVEEITDFIKNKRKGIIFSTYKSLNKLITSFRNVKCKNLLFIFDEAHKICENKDIKHTTLYKLQKINNKIKNCIFATATPKYFENKEKRIGMDNDEYFGEVICNVPMTRLISENFLCKYKILIKNSSVESINTSSAALNILKNYLKAPECDIKKVLLYTKSIDSIKEIYKKLTEDDFYKNINIYRAHSKMKNLDIEKNKREFISSEKISIMVNCQLFTEGINIPELDTVVFCDPKNSSEEIIQCIGRPLRYNRNDHNKIAKIFIPIIQDEPATYSNLINTLEVIASQDPNLRNEISSVIKGNRKSGSGGSQILDIDINIENHKELKLDLKSLILNNLEDAILFVLKNQAMSKEKILIELLDRELFKTNIKLLSNTLNDLYNKGIIKKISNPVKYYINKNKKPTKLSLEEFINKLKELNIKTEEEYRDYFSPYLDNDFPMYPVEIHTKFNWLMLDSDDYYNLEEVIDALTKLENIPELLNCITDLEKCKVLNKYDNKIPKDMIKQYKKKLYQLNSNIFRKLRR